MPAKRPTLHIVAGPNGAGKTTFYETQLRALTTAEFVNADQLALERFGHPAATEAESAYGQEAADTRRRELISAGQSLIVESTFSHPSKLELIDAARDEGFLIVVYHLNVRTPEHAVTRVGFRVAQGGHPVPEQRIRARYDRNRSLIRQAVLSADRALVFDNSRLGEAPELLLTFTGGTGKRIAPEMPEWAETLYGDDVSESPS